MNTTTQMRFGTNQHGTPQVSTGGCRCWERIDTYTSTETGETFLERRACAGPNDDSPVAHAPYADMPGTIPGYDPRCPCCWLGFSHTVNYHTAAIGGVA